MSRILALFVLLACASLIVAGEPVKVEVPLTSENTPAELKVGDRIDLKMVLGKTVGGKGKVLYQTRPIASDLEVLAIKRLGEQANVELRVTKEQSALIEKVKSQVVDVVETGPDRKAVLVKRSIPLRVELRSVEKK